MQNAVSFISNDYNPGTDSGFGSFKKQVNESFSAVIGKELDKAGEALNPKKTPVTRRESKPAKNNTPDDLSALAAAETPVRERRNNFKVSEDNSAVDKADGISADEAETDMEVKAQVASDDFIKLESTLEELSELLKSPEAKELFDMLSANGTQAIDIGELVARLEAILSEDDSTALTQFAKELLLKLEGIQAASADALADGGGIVETLDPAGIDDAAMETDTGAASVMEFGAKLRRIIGDINRAQPDEDGTEEIPEDAESGDARRPVLETADGKQAENDEKRQRNESGSKEHIVDTKRPVTVNTLTPDSSYINAAIKTANVQVNQAAANIQSVPVMNMNDIIGQIVEKMTLESTKDTTQMELRLSPEFLGKLSIVLTSTPDGVSASIRAANDSVRIALAANIAELEGSLKASGINMKDISVTEERMSWDFTRGGQGGAQTGEHERRRFGENLRDTSEHRRDYRSGRITNIINFNNNYNADALDHMANPASLMGSVEFLA